MILGVVFRLRRLTLLDGLDLLQNWLFRTLKKINRRSRLPIYAIGSIIWWNLSDFRTRFQNHCIGEISGFSKNHHVAFLLQKSFISCWFFFFIWVSRNLRQRENGRKKEKRGESLTKNVLLHIIEFKFPEINLFFRVCSTFSPKSSAGCLNWLVITWYFLNFRQR